jgi:hypothetical protein
MKFIPIPKEHIDNMWEHIEPTLHRAVGLTPDRIDTNHVRDAAEKGIYLLWIVFEEKDDQRYIEAVITTRVVDYPKSRALAVDFVAGRRMKEWLPVVMPILEEVGNKNDCNHIEGYGRRAWFKYLQNYDWKPRHVQFEKRLK